MESTKLVLNFITRFFWLIFQIYMLINTAKSFSQAQTTEQGTALFAIVLFWATFAYLNSNKIEELIAIQPQNTLDSSTCSEASGK